MLLHAGLLRQICLEPADMALRLFLADWLEEQGHPGAELIRVQCQLEPLFCTGRGLRRCRCRHCRLQRHEEKLLQDKEILQDLLPLGIPVAWCGEFTWGLVGEVRLTLAEFLGQECPECKARGCLHLMLMKPEDFSACCGGLGYLGGAAQQLVQSAPLQRIILADRRPTNGRWLRSPDSQANPGYIPPRLFRFLRPRGDPRGYRSYPPGQDANLGLAEACVAYARELAFGPQPT